MKTTGFSLIELMVTVLIFAILAIVAYPSYVSQVTKTRRTNAMGLLVQDAAYLERCYSLNGSYTLNGNNSCTNLPYICSPSSSYNAQLNPPCNSTGNNPVYYVISVNTAPSCPFPCPVTSGSTSTCTYSSGSVFLLTATPQGTQTSDGTLTLQSDSGQGWVKNPSNNVCSWQ